MLLVEDHIDARLVLEEFLEKNGFATSVTKTADEATALLRGGFAYDVILLDLMLPGRDGSELLAQIRASPAPLCDVQVVIVSAFAPPTVPGADAVLPKPVDLSKLLELVQRSAQKRTA